MTGYGVFARWYDRLTDNVDYEAMGRFCQEKIRHHAPGANLVLDLACGTGSLSLILSAQGREVIGVDASPDMLSIAMKKALENNRQILFLNQAAEDLNLYGTVDACVCALDSLNHLPSGLAFEKAISGISLFLAARGVFMFDLNTAYKHRHVLADNTFVYDMDDLFCVWQNSPEGTHDTVRIDLDFFERRPDNTWARYSESFRERIFSDTFVREVLRKNRLQVVEVLDGDTYGEVRDDTQRLLYVTIKQ